MGTIPLSNSAVHAAESPVPTLRVATADDAVCIDRMVGFAQLRLGASHERVEAGRPAEVVRLYVQEAFAGRGIGTTLLAAVEALAASSGATHAWLTAWVGNPRALAFYPRRGCAELGSTPYTFEGEHHENRLFVKPLATDDPEAAHE